MEDLRIVKNKLTDVIKAKKQRQFAFIVVTNGWNEAKIKLNSIEARQLHEWLGRYLENSDE